MLETKKLQNILDDNKIKATVTSIGTLPKEFNSDTSTAYIKNTIAKIEATVGTRVREVRLTVFGAICTIDVDGKFVNFTVRRGMANSKNVPEGILTAIGRDKMPCMTLGENNYKVTIDGKVRTVEMELVCKFYDVWLLMIDDTYFALDTKYNFLYSAFGKEEVLLSATSFDEEYISKFTFDKDETTLFDALLKNSNCGKLFPRNDSVTQDVINIENLIVQQIIEPDGRKVNVVELTEPKESSMTKLFERLLNTSQLKATRSHLMWKLCATERVFDLKFIEICIMNDGSIVLHDAVRGVIIRGVGERNFTENTTSSKVTDALEKRGHVIKDMATNVIHHEARGLNFYTFVDVIERRTSVKSKVLTDNRTDQDTRYSELNRREIELLDNIGNVSSIFTDLLENGKTVVYRIRIYGDLLSVHTDIGEYGKLITYILPQGKELDVRSVLSLGYVFQQTGDITDLKTLEFLSDF